MNSAHRAWVLALGAGVAHGLLLHGRVHWHLGLGLLFVALWLVAPRRWPWLMVVASLMAIGTGLANGPWHDMDRRAFVWGVQMASAATAATVMRWSGVRPNEAVDTRRTSFLHLAALAATAVSAASGTDAGHLLDAFLGIMLVAPVAIWWLTHRPGDGSRAVLRDGMLFLLPLLLALVLATRIADSPATLEILRFTLLAAIVLFAMRHGWRGAVLSVLAASAVLVAQSAIGRFDTGLLAEVFLTLAGALGLLYGAAADEHSSKSMALKRATQGNEHLRFELAMAAEGNIHREQRERNRLALEIQNALGQNVTALQTQLVLLRDDFRAIGEVNALENLHAITRTMRQNMSTVLERLRPAVLGELGLFGAVDRGAIRQLAEDAGLHFEAQLGGDARWLALMHDAHKLAAYRLIQESVTNVVRHASATRCLVRIRIDDRNDALLLFIEVRDNGVGIAHGVPEGNGLRTMRDRVTALDGRLLFRPLHPGLRVHALFRQSLIG